MSWRLHRFKSRQRVTIRLAVGLIRLICLGAWMTAQAVQRELRGDIDERLRRNAAEIVPIIEGISPEAMPEVGGFFQQFGLDFGHEEWTLVVHAPGAEPIVLGADEQLPDVVETPIAELRGRGGEPFTTDATDGSDDAFRVLAVPIDDGRVAAFAAPLDDVKAVMRILHKTFAVGAVISVLALGLMVWLVSRQVLKPLEDMVETAHAIGAGNLDVRVDVDCTAPDVERLRDALNTMLDRLQAAFAQQERSEARLRQFVANASHELRTPLTITQALLDVARKDPDRDTEALLEHLHTVNARAIELTEALLTLSRADGRAFTREDVDLSLVAEEAAEALQPLAETRAVSIRMRAEPATVFGSNALLLQLTTNLLHNAIVHNLPSGGSVDLRTRVEGLSAVLEIDNTGEVLSPTLVATLTEPFRRGAERVRTDHAGVGLGLAIVDRIVRAHDGTLDVRPREGGGLRVTVRLSASRGTTPLPD